ncbi:type I restriction enzyme R subunit [Prosthecobacter fusiformis]|uniref:Type I restriction enzyme R subunit n=1 Tax=Prosthecobacter fusiformis TaxID=48464 RepID=A0A4R7RZQ4_9BACT|nr:transposase [Prosthecobacter fusiformis]TDU71470.1 type I restriction enzyme R subunit [Prosthecobacter fusiformis]
MPKQSLSRPVAIPASPVFTEFEGEDFWQVPGYHRNLPHWRLAGAIYFVTFRLADSIPASVVMRWQQEEAVWLQSQGIHQDWRHQDKERFVMALRQIPLSERQGFERKQTRKFFVELDQCHGLCVLKEARAAQSVADALHFFHGQRLWLGDFVIMPNHVHVMVQMFEGCPLEEWLYSVKRFSARQLLKEQFLKTSPVTRAGHLWQTESFDRIIRNRDELNRTRDYIQKNPAKLKPGSFMHHKAAWLDEVQEQEL